MPKLLPLAFSSSSGTHNYLPGARHVDHSTLFRSFFENLERVTWIQNARQMWGRAGGSKSWHCSDVYLQQVSVRELNPLEPAQLIPEKSMVPGVILDRSAASMLRGGRSNTALSAAYGRFLPTPVGGDGQGLPTVAVRHHMGCGGHHHSPEIHDLNPADKNAAKAGEKISRIGLGADVLLTLGKGAAGFVSGSTAIIADAAHSVSDIGLSAVTLWSVRTGSVPADKEHPYGHGKFEALGALGISAVLMATGSGIAWHTFEVLQSIMPVQDMVHAVWSSHEIASPVDATPAAPLDVPKLEGAAHDDNHDHHGHHTSGGLFSGHDHGLDENNLGMAVSAAVVSIGVKESLFWATKAVGERTGSSLLAANAWHHRTDAITSMVALVGAGGAWYGVPWLDPAAGLLVSTMILRAGTSIALRSIRELADEGIREDELAPIRATVLSVKGVEGCHALRGRRMGSRLHIDLHIQVDPSISVGEGHEIGDAVKSQVRHAHRAITDILVHVDPADGRPISLTPAEAEADIHSHSHSTVSSQGHPI